MSSEQTYSAVANVINHPDAINPYQCLWNYRILRSLSEAGTDLDVVSPRPYAPPWGPYSEYSSIPATEDWGAYTVHHPHFWYLLPKRLFYGVSGNSYAKRIPKYVEKTFEVPDVVHACHIYPDGYGMLPYVRKHDIPLFVVSHRGHIDFLEDQPRSVRSKILETLDEAAGILCVSDKLTKKAKRLTDPSKVDTVPIGAEPDEFPIDQSQRLRRELDIGLEETVVLFVGRFIERKGIRDICEILPELDLDDTVFAFIGHDDEMEEELKSAVAKSGFSNRYIYLGVTSLALRRWYAVADLLFLPSYSEGRPTVIYEAMASKTAVLSTEVDGIPEQVVDGETGVLVQPGDIDAIKSEIRTLSQDRARLRRMGEAGYRRINEKNWTWSDHADKVQRLHRAAIESSNE